MITADKIHKLAYLSTGDLQALIQKSYPKDRFLSSRFLGITNGHQFCYSVTYRDPDYAQAQQTKVFVSQDSTADY